MKQSGNTHSNNTEPPTNSISNRNTTTKSIQTNRKSSATKSKTKRIPSQLTTSTPASTSIYHSQNSNSTLSGNGDNQSGASPSGREKGHHKMHTGLDAKSIKCFWKQHDESGTKVNGEVYIRLAKDCTYKLWEIANNLKTYARHSGGKLNVDVVSEVLKDSDVPPVIGAGKTNWNKIENEGTYFYHFDEALDLRDEYQREVEMIQSGPLELTTNWWSSKETGEDLRHLCSDLCYSIFTGNEAIFDYAIHTTLINPFISCITRPILVKCIEMLACTYTEDTLDRCLKFLYAIVCNCHTRDSAINDQLFHLSQLFTCLLLGPLELNDSKIQLNHNRTDAKESILNYEHKQREEKINCISKELQNIKPETISSFASLNVEDICNNYKDLVEVLEDEGIIGKLDQQDVEDFKDFKIKEEYFEQQPQSHDVNIKIEPSVKSEVFNHYPSISTSESYEPLSSLIQANPYSDIKSEETEDSSSQNWSNDVNTNELEYFSPISTEMCADRFVDDVCRLIGSAADKWGYLEKELIFLLSNRLEHFFRNLNYKKIEYDCLSRIIRGLVALGNFAIRELIQFLYNLNPYSIPQKFECHFSQIGMFLRGKSDIFFYEYLYEICGDSLSPFMIYYASYREKQWKKTQKRKEKLDNFEVNSKLLLKYFPRKPSSSLLISKNQSIANVFPNSKPLTDRSITLNIPEWIVLPTKPKTAPGFIELVQDVRMLENFNKKIVIGKRKIIKPIRKVKTKDVEYNRKNMFFFL